MNYREVIESRYNRAKWQELLHDIFGSKVKFWINASEVSTSSPFAQQAWWLGTITLSDEQTIAVYEVELAESVDIERNRRGIRDMLLTDWRDKGSAGAFMFCYRKHESVLRFSYVSESWKFADDGTYQKESTDTRRFTYLLGEGHRSRTAIHQFETLKNSDLKLRDLTKAFSVDAVSDMFFAGYKKQYEDIIQYVTGIRMIKVANKWEEHVVGNPCMEIIKEFAIFPNPEKSIRDYVKKLMGRLVFLQFLQKKGWLGVPIDGWWGDGDPEFLQTLFSQFDDKDHFVDNVLEPLFNDLNTERKGDVSQLTVLDCQFKVPYLNGGLFEREATDQTLFPLPAKYMQSMLDFFSSYNFTIDENDPDDAEVGIDPEMLGRIFENLLEDNKDKGAFYTPKEIVTYMCRESLIAYLQTDIEDALVKETIREFVTSHNANVLGNNAERIDQKLKDVKICDPAIGSGAFPMGLLKELFMCRTAIEGIEQSNAAVIKKHIIQQNIYGVDIERGAVDIARLRFWLALIVDEETPQSLPNLDYKIMQGNSLVSTFCGDYINLDTKEQNHTYTNRMRQVKHTLLDLKRRYYTASGAEKDDLSIAIKDNILQLISLQLGYELRSWAEQNAQTSLFPSPQQLSIRTIIQQLPPERQRIVQLGEELRAKLRDENIPISNRAQIDIRFFNYPIMFTEVYDNEQPGFDIIIGNPPYIKEYENQRAFELIKGSKYYKAKMDIWFYFACVSIDLAKENGIISIIAQPQWRTSSAASILRNKICNETQLLQNTDFGTYMVFEASTQAMVLLLQKKQVDNYNLQFKLNDGIIINKDDLIKFLHKPFIPIRFCRDSFYDAPFSFILDSGTSTIINKVQSLKNFEIDKNKEIIQGIIGGPDDAFKLDASEIREYSENERHYIKPFHTSTQRYYTPDDSECLLYISDKNIEAFSEAKYPAIYKKLLPYKSVLEDRREVKNGKKSWFSLWWERDESFFMPGPKIVFAARTLGRNFTYSDASFYASRNCFFIKCKRINLKYLTGLLNSKLMCFYMHNLLKHNGDLLQLDKVQFLSIPIYNPVENEEYPIVKLVDQIITLKKDNPTADISTMEDEIDRLIYILYNLTSEEIALIEQKKFT